MVRVTNPDQLQLAAYAFGIAVDELGGQALHRPEELAPHPGKW